MVGDWLGRLHASVGSLTEQRSTSDTARRTSLAGALLVTTAMLGAGPLLVTAADPEGADAPASAQPIDVELGSSTTVSGTLDADDVDWYAVALERGEVVRVNVTNSNDVGARFDASLERRNASAADGYSAVGNGQTGSRVFPGDTEDLAFVAPADGTYLVWLGSNNHDGENRYTFDVRRLETDSYEPNDRPTSAVDYAPGSTQSGELYPGDNDWFRFDADAGQQVNVSLTWPADNGGQMDTGVYRLNTSAEGDRQALGDDGLGTRVFAGDTETLSFEAPSDGTYLVRVEHQGTTGDFSFEASVSGESSGGGSAGFTASLAIIAILATAVGLGRKFR